MDNHNTKPRSPSQEVFTSLLRPPPTAPTFSPTRPADDRHGSPRIGVDDILPVLLNTDVLHDIEATGWLDEYVTGALVSLLYFAFDDFDFDI
jgi:hypothetical protein